MLSSGSFRIDTGATSSTVLGYWPFGCEEKGSEETSNKV